MASTEPLPSGAFQGIYFDRDGKRNELGPFSNQATALKTAQTAERQAQRDPAKAKWADWFQLELSKRTWTQADFVRATGDFVAADRVSKWLAAKVMPSYRLAIAAADAFGLPHAVALIAGGFAPDSASAAIPDPLAVLAMESRVHQEKLAPFSVAQLAAEILRRSQDTVRYIGTELAELQHDETRQEGTD